MPGPFRTKRLNARNKMRGRTRSRTLGKPSINRTTLQLRPDNLPFLQTHRTYESRDFARRTPYRVMNRSRREYPTEIPRPMYSPVKYSNRY